MKRSFLLSCGMLACLASASAQITLSDTSYTTTFVNTADSGSIAIGPAGVPVVTGGPTNAMWDLSGAQYAVNDTLFVMHNTAPASYTYTNFIIHVIGGPYYIDTRPLFTLDANGLVQAGENIDGRAYSLSALTGAQPNDSLTFQAQQNLFTSGHTFIKFPATYNSTWSSNYTSNITFLLTYGGFYNQAPGNFVSNITETDTVMGWGKMRVKNLQDTASGYMDVLQVKVKTTEVDSFMLNGAPASPLVVNAFGLTQGTTTTTYSYKFYRRNEVTPLAEITFNDSSYSNSSTSTTRVHEQRLAMPSTAVANVIKASEISIYPNPVSDHTINITVPQTNNGMWSYELMNVLGQTVSTNILSLNGQSKTQIALPNLAPGLYYLHLNNNGQSIAVKPISIM